MCAGNQAGGSVPSAMAGAATQTGASDNASTKSMRQHSYPLASQCNQVVKECPSERRLQSGGSHSPGTKSPSPRTVPDERAG